VAIDDYLDKLVEYCIMKLYCIATVKETRQTWADEDDFQVLKPSITVKVRIMRRIMRGVGQISDLFSR